ncbi:MAG TPA: DUF4037 domain-containing protein [Streptosporangiaceae bacterium]|nr:DUF4037 domain-containing protein [Streptosporangiaceae bacterium]
MGKPFLPGLELARQFYTSVVRPLLDDQFPALRYSAALLGPGSEVLGFDTPRSTDHDWGPRLLVLLGAGTPRAEPDRITSALASGLPASFHGYPVRFPLSGEPAGAARHHVRVSPLDDWLRSQLGFDPAAGISTLDWLATPAQRLAELAGGAVFHDGLGALAPARASLAWYPQDIWCYLLACQWQRIGQEEPFPGRCAEAGDELGSVVLTARLARDLMRLCLLMDRRYPPYSKWLGTAFARSAAGPAMGPPLRAALAAGGWPAREQHLSEALLAAAAAHNRLGLTGPVPATMRPFWDRPYLVLGGGRFAAALRGVIADPAIRALPMAGAVDQFTDSTDALADAAALRAAVAALLHGGSPAAR